MKHLNQLLRFVILLLTSSSAFGQPTITNQIMIETGTTAPVQYFEQTNFAPGPGGANQNWDMSQLPAKGQPIEWQAQAPAATTWGSAFPTATHAFHFPQDSVEGTLYYRYDGEKLFLLGTISAFRTALFQDTLVYDFNEDPQLEMSFPFSFQDQVRDTATGTAIIAFGGNGITVDRTIYRTIRADGYGSLTTPYSTFSNTLRVVIEETVEDRTFGQIVTRQANRRYYWYAPGEKYLVLQMDSLAVLPVAGPSSVSYNMFYRSGEVTTGIDRNIASDINLKVFPNPAHDQLNIALRLSSPEKIQLQIRDLQGRMIMQTETMSTHNISLDLPEVTPGFYLLHVQTSQGKAYQWIAIQ